MSEPSDNDDPRPVRVGMGIQRFTPTLDEDEQGRRSLDLVDDLFDAASAEAEADDGPPDPRAYRLAAIGQRLAAEGRARAAARERFAAGTDGPTELTPRDDGVITSADRGPDTAQIMRLDRERLEALVLSLHRQRGLVPTLTFEGLEDGELVQLARMLRAR